MKRLSVAVFAMLALSSFFAGIAAATPALADPAGTASLVLYPYFAAGFSQFQVEDDGGKLIGVSGATVYLEQQNGGYKGSDFGRSFDLACGASSCTDNGSTQLDLAITPISGGYRIDGTLNFVTVHAVNAGSRISVSALGGSTDVSLELTRQADGSYSGNGVEGAARSFSATLTDEGSLSGLTSPATFVVLLISPLVGD